MSQSTVFENKKTEKVLQETDCMTNSFRTTYIHIYNINSRIGVFIHGRMGILENLKKGLEYISPTYNIA